MRTVGGCHGVASGHGVPRSAAWEERGQIDLDSMGEIQGGDWRPD